MVVAVPCLLSVDVCDQLVDRKEVESVEHEYHEGFREFLKNECCVCTLEDVGWGCATLMRGRRVGRKGSACSFTIIFTFHFLFLVFFFHHGFDPHDPYVQPKCLL